MEYYFDTEFEDDGHSIEFVSIGVVAEDGREYYAVNADMDVERVTTREWMLENVWSQLPLKKDGTLDYDHPDVKPVHKIRDELTEFFLEGGTPKFWAWYASHDYVVLCNIYGGMLETPEGFPHFVHDARALVSWREIDEIPPQTSTAHDALNDARHLKTIVEYIKQEK